MSYQAERERFIVRMTALGLDYPTVVTLLRLAKTLNRLAVAQCNGDYPADNGERKTVVCPACEQAWSPAVMARSATRRYVALVSDQGTAIPECVMLAEGTGTAIQTGIEANAPADAARPFVWRSVTKNSAINPPICPDCRTQDRAKAALLGTSWFAVFGGDPRGYTLKLAKSTVSRDDIDNGRAEQRGDVIGVPS